MTYRLTARELEVVEARLVARSNGAAAKRLGIAESTVVNTLRGVFKTVGARDFPQAVHLLTKSGQLVVKPATTSGDPRSHVDGGPASAR